MKIDFFLFCAYSVPVSPSVSISGMAWSQIRFLLLLQASFAPGREYLEIADEEQTLREGAPGSVEEEQLKKVLLDSNHFEGLFP